MCAAFLTTFSAQLRALGDFQSLMLFIQDLPTSSWGDREMRLVLAEAYRLKYIFSDAAAHTKAP